MPRRLLLIGPWAHASGLGEAARGALQALWGLPPSWQVDAEAVRHFGPHPRMAPSLRCRDSGTSVGDPEVTWLHMNPDAACACLDERHRNLLARSRHVVATWVWESQQLPASWHQALAWIDQLWVPSHYVQELLQPYTAKPVKVIPHLVEGPDRLSNQRQRTILYTFDGASYLHRKNPDRLLQAFLTSGLASRGWRLILKTRNLNNGGAEPERLMRFQEQLETAHREWPGTVELIDKAMSGEELANLFHSSAIYASPHASEGFGLTVAEAMAHGCLVVASDHGGCRDWLTAATGFPLPCALESISAGYGAYPSGSVWARVEADSLALALRKAADLHDHQPEAAKAMRGKARAAIADQCGLDAVRSAIEDALQQLTP